MKIVKIIGIILLAFVGLLLILAVLQPANGHVEKSIVIKAPPERVFKEINGFKSFREWSPWAKMDPAAVYAFEGPEEGVGAKLTWAGKEVGKGSQWIEESIENKKVTNALTFEGYEGKAYAVFILEPFENGSSLTWTYDGVNDGLTGKVMWLFMGGMMEDWYRQGLDDLKKYIENKPATSGTSSP